MKEFEDELSPEEREAFRSLAKEKTPPDFLEQRVVEALRESRLLQSSWFGWPRSSIRIGSAVAASLALFILGVACGAWWRSARSQDQSLPEFMLVLKTSSQELRTRSSEEVQQRVKEYNAWAEKTRKEGLLLEGEKLMDEARFLTVVDGHTYVSEHQSDTKESTIAGYFLIRAQDYQQAIRIAAGCPHLKYGGTVEIRQIDLEAN